MALQRGLIVCDTLDEAIGRRAEYERLNYRPFSIFRMHDGSYGFQVP